MVPLGKYQHYKGGEYEVLLNALLENTEESAVVYKTMYENSKSEYWIRTEADFTAAVEVDGKTVPRFQKID